MANDLNLVQAIYTFKGKNNDELCFKKGDIITVSQREEGGWWEGTLGETTGWFPSNYVKEHKDSGGSAATSPVRAPSEIQAFRNVVLKDIIDSEKAHVAEIQGLITNFLSPLEKSDLLTRDEYKQLTSNILEVLQIHEELLTLIEECGSKNGPEQRVGGLFLQWAPKINAVHQTYCAAHPRAVCILDKYKDELNAFMERCGAVCPGILVLTTGLSKPFRRLNKYAAMLQELGRHVMESHPDRGDTHRAVAIYKEIASTCAATRRQKELELQVVTGAVRGWQGAGGARDLASLGEVLHMGGVALGDTHADRYFVLFPSTLLVLSVSRRMSAFVYEGCLPLTGITVSKLEDTDMRKNAFEITGPLIDTIVAVCQSSADAEKWVKLLLQYANPGRSTYSTGSQPQSPSHESICSTDRESKPRNPRDSLYHLTMPPSTYPSASPYAALSKYFAKLVRLRVITRAVLKQLLYIQPGPQPDFSHVKFRHKHISQVALRVNEHKSSQSEETDESDTETDSTSSKEYYLEEPETTGNGKISRQNALDRSSPRTISSDGSSHAGSPCYVRYYNSTNKDENDDLALPRDISVADCTHEIFQGVNELKYKMSADTKSEKCPVIRIEPDLSMESTESESSKMPLGFINQYSESSDNSSFDCGTAKPYMGCEDLVNMDQNLAIESMGRNKFIQMNLLRQSCPTKFVANRFNDCSLTSVCTPGWQSCSENALSKLNDTNEVMSLDTCCDLDSLITEERSSSSLNSGSAKNPTGIVNSISAEMLHSLEPPSCSLNVLTTSESTSSDVSQETVIKLILDPPPMFQNDLESTNPSSSRFERHLLNSDKRLRRSSSRSLDIAQPKEHSAPPVNLRTRNIISNPRQCVSCHVTHAIDAEFDSSQTNCDFCHSPRSSDSGVAGSCNMTSPEILNRVDSLYTPSETRSLNEALYPKTLCSDYSMSTGEITRLNYMRDNLTRSELEAAKFEEQCPCTSPFSTPRTSCQPSVTSENMTTGTLDSAHTSVTASFLDSIPYPPNIWRDKQMEPENERKQSLKITHIEKPQLYRKPSRHYNDPRNVRLAAVSHGWSTPDMSSLDMTINHMGGGVGTNHKRSHSFNNHHSYTQYVQHQHQKNQPTERTNWLQSSCDALLTKSSSPSSTRLKSVSVTPKISAFDFAERFNMNANFDGWSVRSLRPAAPLRPLPASVGGAEDSSGAAHPYAPSQRKVNSYEEDGLILRVIEAYCTSARSRNTVNSDCEDELPAVGDWLVRSPSLPLHSNSRNPPNVWPTILHLQEDVRKLKGEMKNLRAQLNEERQERMLSIAALQPNNRMLRDAKESNC